MAQPQTAKKKIGNYIINTSQVLGRFSNYIIYQARNIQTKELVAAKCTPKQILLGQDDYTKNALLTQLEAIKQLNSPNIIKFIQVIESTKNIYIFQEFVDGTTLGDLLKKKGRFGEAEIIQCIVQILSGFKQLINYGIVHRDIKPQIFLIKDDMIKISDFSMCKICGQFSNMEQFVGTPLYMAPQVLSSGKYTYKCDIWALGAIFYELVVGQVPWKLGNNSSYQMLLQKIKEILKNGLNFPENIQLSKQYKDLVLGCLRYEQSERFDWDQIYNHKLFQGKFNNLSTTLINKSTINELRKKIQANKVNVEQLTTKLPQKITRQQCSDFFKLLNENITKEQIDNIYDTLSKGNEFVLKNAIVWFLKAHGMNNSGAENSGALKSGSENQGTDKKQ